jgi:glycosyltransferase involved in cell wall biosynthesis
MGRLRLRHRLMTELSILIPVLGRPQNASCVVDSILRTTGSSDYEIVFIATDDDDAELTELDAIASQVSNVRTIVTPRRRHGDYAHKINLAFRETTSPWLFLGADDLRFHPDWFDNAKHAALTTQRRVVGTQDLGNSRVISGNHATHSLVNRSYIDQHGTIDERGKVLHEGYMHTWVDDEFIATAKHRDEFVFCFESVVEHLHPDWRKADPRNDLAYGISRRSMSIGRRIYVKRSRMWTSS